MQILAIVASERYIEAGSSTTVAGSTPGYGGDGGPAIEAQLGSPSEVAVDGSGNLYIADSANNRIRKIDTSGIITTVAGNGMPGYGGDGGPAIEAQLGGGLRGVCVDAFGNLVYRRVHAADRILKVDTGGIVTTVAGNGKTAGWNSLATVGRATKHNFFDHGAWL